MVTIAIYRCKTKIILLFFLMVVPSKQKLRYRNCSNTKSKVYSVIFIIFYRFHRHAKEILAKPTKPVQWTKIALVEKRVNHTSVLQVVNLGKSANTWYLMVLTLEFLQLQIIRKVALKFAGTCLFCKEVV